MLFEEPDTDFSRHARKLQFKLDLFTVGLPDVCAIDFGNFKITLTKPLDFRQVMFVIRTLIDCFHEQKMLTVRDVYYMSSKLFKSTKIVSNILIKLARFLGVEPTNLPILASLKGLCFGSAIFYMNDTTSKCCKNDTILIPRIQCIDRVDIHGKILLIVEKDAAFQNITQLCVKGELNNIFVITGKGFPDKNTQLFIKNYAKTFESVHVLVDMDPHGLFIYKTYLQLAPIVFNLLELKISENESTKLSHRDYKLLFTLIGFPKTSQIAQRLFFMGCKYEIEQMDINEIIEYLLFYTTMTTDILDFHSDRTSASPESISDNFLLDSEPDHLLKLSNSGNLSDAQQEQSLSNTSFIDTLTGDMQRTEMEVMDERSSESNLINDL